MAAAKAKWVALVAVTSVMISLGPASISEQDMDTFTSGSCHVLARELHQRTGWPVVAVVQGRAWTHMAVRAPDGRLVDIEGAQDPADVLANHGWSRETGSEGWSLRELDEQGYAEMTSGSRFAPQPWETERARTAAEVLLREV